MSSLLFFRCLQHLFDLSVMINIIDFFISIFIKFFLSNFCLYHENRLTFCNCDNEDQENTYVMEI